MKRKKECQDLQSITFFLGAVLLATKTRTMADGQFGKTLQE